MQKLAHAIEIFLFCFPLVSLGALVSFLILERKRLTGLKNWLAFLLVLAHLVLYLRSAAGFVGMLVNVHLENPAASVALYFIPVLAIFTFYILARKRLAPSGLQRRFFLLPLASVSLGVLGAWFSLMLTFTVLQLG